LAAEEAKARRAAFDQAAWLERFVRFAGASGKADTERLFEAWLELGDLHVLHGRHDDAQKAFDQAAGFASGSRQKSELAFARASLHYNLAGYDKALEAFSEAYESGISREKRLLSRIRMAFIRHIKGASDEAVRILDETLEAMSSLPDGIEKRRLEAMYDNTRGFIDVQFSQAERGTGLCRRAVAIFGEIGDTKQQARAMLNLASTLSSFGAWEERLKLLGEAVGILTESGDVHSLMVAYINLGQVYQAINQDDFAEDYFKRCLDLVEATGTPRFRVWAECHLGTIEEKRGNYEDSLKHLTTAVDAAGELGYTRMAVICNLNIAITLARMRRFEEAWAVLGGIESEPAVDHMGAGIRSAVHQVFGFVGWLDDTGDRRAKLEQAAERLVRAREAGGADLLESLEIALCEARVLKELGRLDAAKIVVAQAAIDIEKCLNTIQSPLIREDLRKSVCFSGLIELRKQLLDQE
ncbi:tetratricopeptide repeat protein, partial [Candidatus Fermentibacteria bacterium]|nr:tetratricopeptide repeat protein [Candidatus Fermentibacteria bacterium]